MSDFLDRLVTRSRDPQAGLAPRPISAYEAMAAPGPLPSDSADGLEPVRFDSDPVRQHDLRQEPGTRVVVEAGHDAAEANIRSRLDRLHAWLSQLGPVEDAPRRQPAGRLRMTHVSPPEGPAVDRPSEGRHTDNEAPSAPAPSTTSPAPDPAAAAGVSAVDNRPTVRMDREAEAAAALSTRPASALRNGEKRTEVRATALYPLPRPTAPPVEERSAVPSATSHEGSRQDRELPVERDAPDRRTGGPNELATVRVVPAAAGAAGVPRPAMLARSPVEPPRRIVKVTIGRVEIRATRSSANDRSPSSPSPRPVMTLDEYLSRRNGVRAP